MAKDTHTIGDWLFGHRVMQAQTWFEYLLEFLNVLYGFGYSLEQLGEVSQIGKGSLSLEVRSLQSSYERQRRLALRRFAFYGEGGRDTSDLIRDKFALDHLNSGLLKRLSEDYDSVEEASNNLENARELLRSFGVVELKRSWFAKSLFPAHQNFLFYELYRRKPTVPVTQQEKEEWASAKDWSVFDSGFQVNHNFYARGGEICYLLLALGTEDFPERRKFIATRIKGLLQTNEALGRLAAAIDDTWDRESEEEKRPEQRAGTRSAWIPADAKEHGIRMAENFECLLRSHLDPLETFVLMSSLIAFHVVEYIYFCCSRISEVSAATSARNPIFVDCMGHGPIRQVAAQSYKFNDLTVQLAPRKFFQNCVKQSLYNGLSGAEIVSCIADTFEFGKKDCTRALDRLLKNFATDADPASLGRDISEMLSIHFDKHHYPIHRNLGKRIGLIAPIYGRGARYMLSDDLLRVLVLTTVPPDEERSFDDWLESLWQRHGIVVGPKQAAEAQSRLPGLKDLNRKLLDRNQQNLRDRLKHNGLLTVFSDAVALVKNRNVRWKACSL